MTVQHSTADNDRMRRMYQERWRVHGASPLSLGWTKDKQDIRFGILLSDFCCDGKSFLDIGCGFGDLNRVLRDRCTDYSYHGLDLVPEFIEEGRSRYGGPGVTFETGSFLEREFSPSSFDYVIASGALSYRLSESDNYAYLKQCLSRMLVICRGAVSVDFLSDRVSFQHEHSFHSNPESVLSIALSLTRNVRLRHDYMPFEFAVTLFKDDSFDDHDTLFRRFRNANSDH